MRLRSIFLSSALLGAVLGAAGGAYALSCAENGTQAELVLMTTTVDGVLVEGEATDPRLLRYQYGYQLREAAARPTYEGEENTVYLQEAE